MTDQPQYLTAAQTKATELAQRCYDEWQAAEAKITGYEELVAARDLALAELNWAAAHPALPEGWKPYDKSGDTAEEKPKRTRRTKAQIAADKAAEEAAKNPAANESDEAASQVEGQGIVEPAVAEVQNNTGEPEPVQAQPEPPAPAPAPAPQPSPPADGGAFNPFGNQPAAAPAATQVQATAPVGNPFAPPMG